MVSWAVLPVGLFHFGTVSPYAIVANLGLIPLFSLYVLPMGALGWMGTAAFGPQALSPAALGADVVLRIATWVASWPAPSAVTLAVVACGLALGRFVPWPSWKRLIPPVPLWVALALVAAVIARGPAPSIDDADWVALGAGRRPPVVRFVGPRRACLVDPRGPVAAWPRRLQALE